MRAVTVSLAAGVAVGIAAAAAVSVAASVIVSACLPDLEVASSTAAVCGDGIIQPDAGEQCDPGDASPSATLCSGCKIECNLGAGSLPFTDPVSHHCYVSFATAIETTADTTCEANGAHVVRFVSQAEVTLVSGVAGTNYWVGLDAPKLDVPDWFPSETTDEPGWSPDCPGCFAHVDAGATDIARDPDTTVDAGRRCIQGASGNATAPWQQFPCKESNLALCEREPVGTRTVSCPAGACFTVAQTTQPTKPTKRYVLTPSPVVASAAVAACDALGGGLVVFGSREEREQVGYEIGTETVLPGRNDFWIGLSSNAGGTWAWDGDAGGLAQLPWAVGEPVGAASARRAYVLLAPGAIDSELAHAQTDAGEMHYAVCEIP